MDKDERDLLEVLKFELNFLEKGGYGRSPRAPWRPQYIFEDSPTCMNYDSKEHPGPCEECVLMHLVPPERRSEAIPCRHIPMGPADETLDSLYRYGEQHEIEETVGKWLRETIERLEAERRNAPPGSSPSAPVTGDALAGTPLFQHLHPKCANPSCPTAFNWLEGGKFFRFRLGAQSAESPQAVPTPPAGHHNVVHFWLCERCARVFTLVSTEGNAVVLKFLWAELIAPEALTTLPAA